MSKMSNLDLMLKELRKNANSVLELADALEKEFSSTEESTPKKKSATKQEVSPTEAEPPVETQPAKNMAFLLLTRQKTLPITIKKCRNVQIFISKP